MTDTSKPFRSVTAGTCALGGKHTPGSQWANECPYRPGGRRNLERLTAASPRPEELPRTQEVGRDLDEPLPAPENGEERA
jgi:hypothetical protein